MALDMFAMVQQLTAECGMCGREAFDLCLCPCRQVFYCDVKCQQDAWHHHRNECTKARRGRLPQSFCSYCGVASVSLKSCLCEAALYCSFECQRKHHGVHGRTCTAALPRFRRRRKRAPAPGEGSETGSDVADDPLSASMSKQSEDTASTCEVGVQTDVSCQHILGATKPQQQSDPLNLTAALQSQVFSASRSRSPLIVGSPQGPNTEIKFQFRTSGSASEHVIMETSDQHKNPLQGSTL
jgi:hypothetical protein